VHSKEDETKITETKLVIKKAKKEKRKAMKE
jgi:hypothetical protein